MGDGPGGKAVALVAVRHRVGREHGHDPRYHSEKTNR
jgi:hypothetical protein